MTEANLIIKEEDKFRRTIPWGEDEFIRVNGLKCVYTTHLGSIDMIIMPGGRKLSWKTALDFGFDIIWPKTIRTVHAA